MRRRYLRVHWPAHVEWRRLPKTEVEEKSAPFIKSEIEDMGLNGLGLILDRPVPSGMPLELKINVGEDFPTVYAQATVVWVGRPIIDGDRSQYVAGVRFVNVPDRTIHEAMMYVYRKSEIAYGMECARIAGCTYTQRVRCPAPEEEKNCWQYDRTPCCSRDRSLCVDCPVCLGTLFTP